jgi:hypothetical protein
VDEPKSITGTVNSGLTVEVVKYHPERHFHNYFNQLEGVRFTLFSAEFSSMHLYTICGNLHHNLERGQNRITV